ncbi:MAG TPA: fumarylacetoacetate hydrolase family protein [Acidimicrobiales bacterium]|nr:fumarylacetoacetate hydrolase family protein [Acidimicrobiales bacterium]
MRLATVRTGTGTRAARVEGDHLVLLASIDVGAVLGAEDRAFALADEEGTVLTIAEASFATLVPRPSKVFCVGLNYRDHILEMGREIPTDPTLFAKFPSALIGAHDDIVIPSVSDKPDWEVELAIVIGEPIHRATATDAHDAIAGFTVLNDISMRDWQRRTPQWLQGKTFDNTTPVGPFLVSLDELDDPFDLEVRCEIDGFVTQHDRTSELVFGPLEIVAYCSQICTLAPGDIISTGTPAGVGDGRVPPVYLRPGQVVTSTIEGVGQCVNRTVTESI